MAPRPWRRAARSLTVAAVLAAGTMSACGPEETTAEFRIGLLVMTDSGYLHSSARPSRNGAEMAAAEINAAGGIVVDGRPHLVRIVVGEYEGRPDAAASGARALLNQDSVHALVGPQLSSHAIPVSVVAENVGVPMISPMSTNPETTRGKDFVSRLAFLDAAQGSAMGRFAVDSLGAERAAVLYDESRAYSRSVATSFIEGFRAAGGAVVVAETYTSDRSGSFLPQLRRIRDEGPDVLFLPNVTQDDSIQMREARALGIEAVFLGSDHWDLHALSPLPHADGAFVAHQWVLGLERPPGDESAQRTDAFARRYAAAHGVVPRATAAMTYDAVMVFATAVADAGTLEGTGVARAVRGLTDYTGVTGPIRFSGSGDPRRDVALSTIRGGRVESLRLITP